MINPIPLDDIIEWDVINWSKCLDFWEPMISGIPATARILALGEQNGGLSLWLASKGFMVICSDAPQPSIRARTIHLRNGVASRVFYMGVDAFRMPFQDNSFDVVICKS